MLVNGHTTGDLERCSLRPGNTHNADGWRNILEPVVERYRDRKLRRYFRGDATFALPDLYEFLEAEGCKYTIRLKVNKVLLESVAHLLTRPVGRPPYHLRRFPRQFQLSGRQLEEAQLESPPRSNGIRVSCTRMSGSSLPT